MKLISAIVLFLFTLPLFGQSSVAVSTEKVKIDGKEGIEDVRNPRRQHRAGIAVDGESRGYGHKEDIRET